jgi:hypothetical protein
MGFIVVLLSIYETPGLIIILKWGTLLVAHLVEALRYKPEGRGFDSRCVH